MTQEKTLGLVESPCNYQCKLDPVTSVCQSCFRTIEEIYTWHQFSNDERTAVISTAAQRRLENTP